MDRPQSGTNAALKCFALLIAAIASSVPACSQQAPASATTPHDPVTAPAPVSGMLAPALDTVHRTLAELRIDKWKKGTVRDEASGNINALQNDLRTNLPPLLEGADGASGTVSVLLPLSRHIDALYAVLLRVSEAARVVAPDDQAEQLQQALLSLSNARLAFSDRMQGSADALEKQVADLRATIQKQAAQRAAEPAPVALPCIPPPTHKATTRTHKPAAKPAPKPPTGTPASKTSSTTTTTPPPSSHK